MFPESMLVTSKSNVTYKQVLLITLLNFNSLNILGADLPSDERLKRSDIICLTEAQLQQKLFPPKSHVMTDCNIIYYYNPEKLQSIALDFRISIDMLLHNKLRDETLVYFSKCTFESKTIKLLLMYTTHSVTLNGFSNWLQEVL